MINELDRRIEPILAEFMQSEPIARIVRHELTPDEYSMMMRQVFHYTRENPQMQTLATVYFRGRERDMVLPFFKHAASEVGHEQLALNDHAALGGDPSDAPYENPLPATSALLSWGFYQIYNLNPRGHLGYVYFLEKLPVQTGGMLMEHLRACGIPDNAMTFLRDHAEVDVGHVKLMEKYVTALIRDERDLDTVEYSMRAVAYYYHTMLSQAIEAAHKPVNVGWNWQELIADGRTPSDARTPSIVAAE